MRALLIAFISLMWLSGFKTENLDSVEIHYDFETVDLASGPDTFELFETGPTDVSISSQYAFRGSHSLHLRDYKESHDFPEFQGYFPIIQGGTVSIGFAFMTPEPNQGFNVAFAGNRHFKMVKNGIGFWIFNDQGVLRHMSDGIPKQLLKLDPFRWYWLNAVLDVSNGTYSLNISAEGGEELVSLKQQKNPLNAKNSQMKMYSFSGDLKDETNSNLYIDEFVLRTDFADSPNILIAPGRRSLFLDEWNKYHKRNEKLNGCIPPKLPYDFFEFDSSSALETLQANVEDLRFLLITTDLSKLQNFKHQRHVMRGISSWAVGCQLLKTADLRGAIKKLNEAELNLGITPATQMALAIANAKIGLRSASHSFLARGQQRWPDDVRWQIIGAAVAFMFDRAQNSEQILRDVAHSLEHNAAEVRHTMENLGWLKGSAIAKVKINDPAASSGVLSVPTLE